MPAREASAADCYPKKHGRDEDEDLDQHRQNDESIISGPVQDVGLTFGQGAGCAAH
jgi:hypothetical protein